MVNLEELAGINIMSNLITCMEGSKFLPWLLLIDQDTKSTLLNLIAYEMCPNHPNDFKVTHCNLILILRCFSRLDMYTLKCNIIEFG